MTSLHCENCSCTLFMLADGSGAVCPDCGAKYSPEHVREMLALLKPDFRRDLKNGRSQLELLCCGNDDATAVQKALDLYLGAHDTAPDEHREQASREIFQGFYHIATTVTNRKFLMPMFTGFHTLRSFISEDQHQQLLDRAIRHMADLLLSPAETALINYQKAPDSAKSESNAAELLRLCNEVTGSTLKLLNCAVTGSEEVLYEAALCPLLERLDRLSWEAESILCFRPLEDSKNRYESYVFMNTASYLSDKNILARNRSIVSTREAQLKQQVEDCRKERMDIYWREHPDQKDVLENRWVELRMEIASLKRKVSLAPQIVRMQQLQTEISQLDTQIAQLGIFHQKEKNALRDTQKILREEFTRLDLEFVELENSVYSKIGKLEEELGSVRMQLDGKETFH